MAEALLRKYLQSSPGQPAIDVASAGLTDQPQERADSRSRAIAGEFGVSLERHRPQRLTSQLIEQADLILIMDYFNEARMLVSFGAARIKVFYLGAFGQERGSRKPEVPTPTWGHWMTSAVVIKLSIYRCGRLATALAESQAEAREVNVVFSSHGA